MEENLDSFVVVLFEIWQACSKIHHKLFAPLALFSVMQVMLVGWCSTVGVDHSRYYFSLASLNITADFNSVRALAPVQHFLSDLL
jgi:hypothetical protein